MSFIISKNILFIISLVFSASLAKVFKLQNLFDNSHDDSDNFILFDEFDELCDYVITNGSECCYSLEIANPSSKAVNAVSDKKCPLDLWRNSSMIVKSLKIRSKIDHKLIIPFLQVMSHVEEIEIGTSEQPNGFFLIEWLQKAQFLNSIKTMHLKNVSNDNLNQAAELSNKMPSLFAIKISKSNLTSINFGLFHKNLTVHSVDISGNHINNLLFPEGFLRQLNHINASNCNLSSITVIPDGKAQKTTNLKSIDLTNNNLNYLSDIFCNAFDPNAQVELKSNPWDSDNCNFYPLWKILFMNDKASIGFEEKKPDLLSCTWDSCPASCSCIPEKKVVDCSYKDLRTIPDVGPSDAEVLILSGNYVESDLQRWLREVVSWCNLRSLSLDHVNITHFFENEDKAYGSCKCSADEDASNCILPHLKEISLSNCQIARFSKIDWKFLRRTKNVNLSNNRIQNLSFNGEGLLEDFSSITILDLSHNKQSSFGIRDALLFPYLTSLNLSFNNLRDFDFGIASFMPLLINLDLSFNKINSILLPEQDNKDPYSTFTPYIEDFYLHKNELQEMIAPIWGSIRKLTLHDNSWNCSRRNIKLMKKFMWKNLRPSLAYTISKWKCYGIEAPEIGEQPLPKHNEKTLITVIGGTVIFFCLLIFFSVHIKRKIIYCSNYICTNRNQHIFDESEYDVFIIYAPDSKEFTNEILTPRLEEANYKVASDDTIPIGELVSRSFYNILGKSRRMLVVISEEFVEQADKYIWELKQGLDYEKYFRHFKVGAIVLEPYRIKQKSCPEEVFLIASIRKPTRSNDINWLNKLKTFLGRPIKDL